jgi:hypothetical protein
MFAQSKTVVPSAFSSSIRHSALYRDKHWSEKIRTDMAYVTFAGCDSYIPFYWSQP